MGQNPGMREFRALTRSHFPHNVLLVLPMSGPYVVVLRIQSILQDMPVSWLICHTEP